jgi:hypothetical protein
MCEAGVPRRGEHTGECRNFRDQRRWRSSEHARLDKIPFDRITVFFEKNLK